MKGLLLINAYLKSQSQYSQVARMREELVKRGVQTDVLRNDGFFTVVYNGEIVSRLKGYDFCVYLDKDKYVSAMLEQCGVRLFNTHEAIRVCDDKMDTYIRLSGQGIAMPKTLSGLLCYEATENVSCATVENVEKELGYPIIIKECYGSLGKGVYMARNREELTELMQRLKMRPHLLQEAVQTSMGKDVRVIVIGGKAVAAMVRRSDSDFRSNVELGGKASAHELTEEEKTLAERVANILQLDYCGIDLLFGKDGPIVCEVNSNAFFGGMEQATGVNVAGLYADWICKEIYGKTEKGI